MNSIRSNNITAHIAQAGFAYFGSGGMEEKSLYYYHSDHLGSTSYVTDRDGKVSQFVAYLPFGESLYEEHSNTRDMPYLFNGKERDEETGLYYYGARYYDPWSAVWSGVDPKWIKYLSLSPFVYCANNPVIYVDPNGKEIWIITNVVSNNGKITFDSYQYKDGKLYTAEGKEYKGRDSYALAVQEDLNTLAKNDPVSAKRMETLQNSDKKHAITMVPKEGMTNYNVASPKDRESKTRTNSMTFYDPYNSKLDEKRERPPVVSLAHEFLGHGWDADRGTTESGRNKSNVLNAEYRAIKAENRIRQALGIPLRDYYSKEGDISKDKLERTY